MLVVTRRSQCCCNSVRCSGAWEEQSCAYFSAAVLHSVR